MSGEQGLQFRRNIQVVFQDPYGSLNPRMTVRNIIGRPLRLHRIVPSANIDDKVAELLELVGLRPAAPISTGSHTSSQGGSANASLLHGRLR